MASNQYQATHSGHRVFGEDEPEDRQTRSSLNLTTSQGQDNYLSLDESISDDEDDSEFLAFLQEPLIPGITLNDTSISSDTTSSPNIYSRPSEAEPAVYTASTPLLSTASQQATKSFTHLQISSPNPPLEVDTDATRDSSQPTISAPKQVSIRTKGKRSSSSTELNREAKRSEYRYNPTSQTLQPPTIVTYIGETIQAPLDHPQTRHNLCSTLNPSINIPTYYPDKHKDWHSRVIFKPAPNSKLYSGLPRIDLYVFAIDANQETKEQQAKKTHHRNMHTMQTPIERFYPQIWDEEHAKVNKNPILSSAHLETLPFYKEPYENALFVIRTPANKFQKVPTAIEEPTEPLHTNPPSQQHSLSEQGMHLMNCDNPIDFFDAIYCPQEMENILEQSKIYRQQNNWHQWLEPTYQEIRCFVGLLLWPSLVQLPNRRAYFTTSQIYHLPHFKAHIARDRFEQLLSMLHFTDNEKQQLK